MIQELFARQFPAAAPLFERMDAPVPLRGVLEGRHPARVLVDRFPDPSCALACTPWGYFYLAGAPNRAFLEAAGGLLTGEIMPAARAQGQNGFILWPDTPDWQPTLPELLPGRALRPVYRRTFDFDPATFYEGRYSRPELPAGFALRALAASVLSRQPDLAGEIETAWGTLDAYTREGVGACILDGERVASACFSIFVGGGAAEANVFTAPDYRQRGLAILACAAWIDSCLKRRLRPNWECFWDNLPSLRLAENLGFKATKNLSVFYWEE